MTAELDGFFLVEEWSPRPECDMHETAAGETALPAKDRKPTEPGFVLTWTEHPPMGEPYQRSGMVLARAPAPKTVWVVPDESRDGALWDHLLGQVEG